MFSSLLAPNQWVIKCKMWSMLLTIILFSILSVAANGRAGGGVGVGGSGRNTNNNYDSTSDVCHHICQCHKIEDNLSVHCVRMNLRNVPPGIPTNVTILDLSMNNISLLTPLSFKTRLPALHRLDLRMNGLTDIRQGSFVGLAGLRELALDHNELRYLHKAMFSDMYSLSMLSVNNNKIASIENGTFKDKTLSHLNLHDNNPLKILQPGIFMGSKVESLSLDRCSLTSIHVDSFMPLVDSLKNLFWSHSLSPLELPARLLQGLELSNLWLSDNEIKDLNFLSHTKALHLDLSINPIGEIDLGAYLAMEHVEFFNLSQTQLHKLYVGGGGNRIMFNLQELDISENFLKAIDGTVFQRMPSLTRLDMSGNQLHYIGASLHLMLYQLEFWDLTGNRLLCDCRLEWLRHWAAVQNKTHLQGAVCGLPRLAPVVGSPEFTCDPPSIQRISSDQHSRDHTWQLQCDAEGWPAPEINWAYNITRHPFLRIHQKPIIYHGHPYRNSSILVISGMERIIPSTSSSQICFNFICIASNSEGKDKTEYVHCSPGHQLNQDAQLPSREIGGSSRRQDVAPPPESTGSGEAGSRGQSDLTLGTDNNSSRAIAPHRSKTASSGTGYGVSAGVSCAVVFVLLAVIVIGLFLYNKRRTEMRRTPRPGWEQPDAAAGENLVDSTKCLVEHSDNVDNNKRVTFSLDTV